MPHVSTKTGPIFLQTAQDLLSRLRQDHSDGARELERRARALVAIFEGWPAAPPTPEARSATIHQLLDLQREALEHIASRGRSSG